MNATHSTRQLVQQHARNLETPEPQKPAARVTARELDSYSISRALESATIESFASATLMSPDPMPPSWQSPLNGSFTPAPSSRREEKSGFEVEISQSLQRDFPMLPGGCGVTIPFGALSRALTPTSFSAGGAFVGTYAAQPEAYVFALSQIYRAGARVFPELGMNPQGVGSIGLPVVEGSQEGQWCSDTETATRSDVSVALRTATPHRVVFQQRVSKQLLRQTKNSDALIAILLAGPLNAAIDRAALAGTGGVQPLGILNTPGVGIVSMGSDGGAPTLAKLNDIEGSVIGANFDPSTASYILSAKVRTKTKNTPKAASTSSYLLETVTGQDYLSGHLALTTTNMPDNGTKGSGSNLGSLTFGDFSKILLCGWAGIHIVRDPFTYAPSNQEIWTVSAYVDIINARPAAFAVSTDILTT